MNKMMIAEAVSLIDESIIDRGLALRERLMGERRARVRKIAAAVAAMAACVMLVCVFALLAQGGQNKIYSVDSLIPMVLESALSSRPSTITPLPEEAYQKNITADDIKSLFGSDVFCDFGIDISNADGWVYYRSSGEVHSVFVRFRVDGTSVYVIVDPNAYPKFVFEGNGNIENIEGYEVGMVTRQSPEGQYTSLDEITDIGMKKGTLGILITIWEDDRSALDRVFNLVLRSKIDFDELKEKNGG